MGEGKSNQWNANTTFDDDLPEQCKRALNGFATITFTRGGGVEHAVKKNRPHCGDVEI